MPVKRYSLKSIELAWALYKKRMVYRALIGGKWQTFPTMAEAREKNPHKVEAKFARDAMEFPAFLVTLTQESVD
jgi:hypothetical protein